MEEWLKAIKDVGTPSVVMFALGLFIWCVTKWFGKEVVIPIRDSHMVFLKGMVENAKVQEENLRMMIEVQRNQNLLLEKMCAESKPSPARVVVTNNDPH